MKRLFAGLLCLLLLLLGACGETAPEEATANTEATTAANPVATETIMTTEAQETKLLQAKETWQEAYTDYLLHRYETVHGFITIGLADFDKSGTPELIIIDDSMGTLGGAFSIVAYQNKRAETLIAEGTSSSYSISDNGKELYFFRSFDSLRSGGGAYGYGYVTRLVSTDGVFAGIPLLRAKITDYSFEDNEALRMLAWEMEIGEANLLRHKEFSRFISIQKHNSEGNWQDIAADEYMQLKKSYLGENTAEYRGYERGDPFALPEISHECFDLSSDVVEKPTAKDIGAFFARWNK